MILLLAEDPAMKPAFTGPVYRDPLRGARGTLLTPRERQAIILALKHCDGMGHRLPLTQSELDALCARLEMTK